MSACPERSRGDAPNLARLVRDVRREVVAELRAIRRQLVRLRLPGAATAAHSHSPLRGESKTRGGRPPKVARDDKRWGLARVLWEAKGWGARRIGKATGLHCTGSRSAGGPRPMAGSGRRVPAR